MDRKLRLLAGLLVAGLALARACAAASLVAGSLSVEIVEPAGWKVTCRDPLVALDPAKGRTGSVQLHAMRHPDKLDPAVAHRGHLAAAQKRVERGELIRAEERLISGVPGVLTVEAAQDPLLRQMQWIGNDRRGYFHWTFASSGPEFDGYLPRFLQVLESATISPGAPPAPH